MKKTRVFLMIMSVLFAALCVAGCQQQEPELFTETYDKWYVYNKEIDAPIANADANNPNKDGVLHNAKVYVKFNKNDGLTMLVATTKTQTIEYLGGAYTVQADVTTGATKTYSTDEFSAKKWKALILFGNFSREEPPTITVDLSDLMGGQFNMKRLLAEWLLNTVLAE